MRQVRVQVAPEPEAIERAWRATYRDRHRRATVISLTPAQLDAIIRAPFHGGGILFANPNPTETLFGMVVERRAPDDLPGIAWIAYEERW